MTFRPFSNGTEHMAWDEDNCGSCVKCGACELQDAISEGAFTGEVPLAIAQRIGVVEKPWRHLGECKERVE